MYLSQSVFRKMDLNVQLLQKCMFREINQVLISQGNILQPRNQKALIFIIMQRDKYFNDKATSYRISSFGMCAQRILGYGCAAAQFILCSQWAHNVRNLGGYLHVFSQAAQSELRTGDLKLHCTLRSKGLFLVNQLMVLSYCTDQICRDNKQFQMR